MNVSMMELGSASGGHCDYRLAAVFDRSAGDRGSGLAEHSRPPLVMISSRVKNSGKWGDKGRGCINSCRSVHTH